MNCGILKVFMKLIVTNNKLKISIPSKLKPLTIKCSAIFNFNANLETRFNVVVSKVEPPACIQPLLAVL